MEIYMIRNEFYTKTDFLYNGRLSLGYTYIGSHMNIEQEFLDATQIDSGLLADVKSQVPVPVLPDDLLRLNGENYFYMLFYNIDYQK